MVLGSGQTLEGGGYEGSISGWLVTASAAAAAAAAAALAD
jgi:hypothetical protein